MEMFARAEMFVGGKEVEVVLLRPAPEIVLPPRDGILRGDGTWPWFAEIVGEDIVVRGAKVTAFGGDDDPQDSGMTASGVPTRGNANLKGCALPMRYDGSNSKVKIALGGSPIPKMPFGLLPPDGRKNPNGAHVEVTDPVKGTKIEVPVIDLGPAKRTGNALDLTVAAARVFRPDATARNFSMRLDFRILKGARFVDRADVTGLVPAPRDFARSLVESAQREFDTFRQTHETASPLRERIEKYWTELGKKFPGVGEPWSAVFVSWNVLKAGAKKDNFTFNELHAKFVHDAIVGSNSKPAFIGRRISEYAPKVGDIIQNNRGNSFDFDHARTHADYKSHSAIVAEVGTEPRGGRFAITIGGNEGDSVGRRRVDLNSDGKIEQPKADRNFYICVLENVLA